MKATGEVMAIDRTFEAALLTALRSLEVKGQDLSWEPAAASALTSGAEVVDRLLQSPPTDDRIWKIFAALRRGADVEHIHSATKIDRWFLERFRNIVRSA